MAAFKQFLQNEEGRDSINSLSMCLDIEAFLEIHPAKKLSRQQLSSTIYRVYFDPSSRRYMIARSFCASINIFFRNIFDINLALDQMTKHV